MDFLLLLDCKIDFYLQNQFMSIRALQWKPYKSSTNTRQLREMQGCYGSVHFSESITTCHPPGFPICGCPCMFEAWVCEFQMSLCWLLKFIRFEEKLQWQLIVPEWLRKPGWIWSLEASEMTVFAECWLIPNDTIFHSDFTGINSLSPVSKLGRGQRRKD